ASGSCPIVVARRARTGAGLAGRKAATPGRLTTAALLLRTERPDVEPVEVRFDDIPRAVLAGEVEAGVIIHESQLTFRDEGLVQGLDFGQLWQEARGAPRAPRLPVVRPHPRL